MRSKGRRLRESMSIFFLFLFSSSVGINGEPNVYTTTIPHVPAQFRAKAHAEVGTGASMLLIVYYDYPNLRTREDYYTLSSPKPQKLYTSIKLFAEGLNFMIFNRVRDPIFSSPHSCFIVPTAGPLLAPDVFNYASFGGTQNLTLRFSESDPASAATFETSVDHWRVEWENIVYNVYEPAIRSASERLPLFIQSVSTNYTLLDFEQGPLTVEPSLFAPQDFSVARCAPFGG